MTTALTTVQKRELSHKFVKSKDDCYLPQHVDNWVKSDGWTARPLRYVAQDAQDEGLEPSDQELKETESYWMKRFHVRDWELRRIEQTKQFAKDWWTFKTICEMHDAPIHGQYGPTVEKFWTTSGLQTLTPIFFDANIQVGMLATTILDRLIMDTVPVTSHTVTHFESTTTTNDLQAGVTGEGAVMISVRVAGVERTIQLKKFASELDVTYETMRLQRTNFLAKMIQRYGQVYANYIADFALASIIDGAGGSGAATTVAATGSIYDDLVDLELSFPQGYEGNTVAADRTVLAKILKDPAFKDPMVGVNHQMTGAIPTPVGMDLIRWDASGNVSTYTTSTLLMFDSNLSLTQYTEGGLITQSEQIIRTQWDRTVTSSWVGFGVWDRVAARLGTGW